MSSRVFVHGCGAISPAGWGVEPLREVVWKNKAVPRQDVVRPGWERPLRAAPVPRPTERPAFLREARLRRASAISHFAVGAALEALGPDREASRHGSMRLGIILCVLSGCVNYSRRFYDETLKDPATASPLVFPETVFNAPGSHLAALLNTPAVNYTMVGDPGTFLQGVALAAEWLVTDHVDGCLVVGAEELDWVTADAGRLFERRMVLSEGAGAIYLRARSPANGGAELICVTDSHLFFDRETRKTAAARVREQLPPGSPLLCDGLQNLTRPDEPERAAWGDWSGQRLSPKKLLGEGLMAGAAWQTALAADAVLQNRAAAANVSIVGCNQQAIGACFRRVNG